MSAAYQLPPRFVPNIMTSISDAFEDVMSRIQTQISESDAISLRALFQLSENRANDNEVEYSVIEMKESMVEDEKYPDRMECQSPLTLHRLPRIVIPEYQTEFIETMSARCSSEEKEEKEDLVEEIQETKIISSNNSAWINC